MTKKQKYLYFTEWRKVEKLLIERYFFEAKEAKEFRHVLHVRALGHDLSSKEFSNRDLDKVLAVFRSYTKPGDLKAQLHQQNQPKIRAAYKLRQLAKKLNLSTEYVDKIAMNICKKTVINCDDKEIVKVITALNLHAKRQESPCLENSHQLLHTVQS